MEQKLSEIEMKKLEELIHQHLLFPKQRKEIDEKMLKEFGVGTCEEAYRLLKENRPDPKEQYRKMEDGKA